MNFVWRHGLSSCPEFTADLSTWNIADIDRSTNILTELLTVSIRSPHTSDYAAERRLGGRTSAQHQRATSSEDHCALCDGLFAHAHSRRPTGWQLFSGNLSFHLQNCVRRSSRRRHKFSSVKIIPPSGKDHAGPERASDIARMNGSIVTGDRRRVVKAAYWTATAQLVAISFGRWRRHVFIVMTRARQCFEV